MQQRIARLSPHQNGKVAAILMAVTSLIFAIPILLIGSVMGSGAMPLWGIIVVPLCYLVIGYITTAIACAIYNALVPFTGGIEYETAPAAGYGATPGVTSGA